MSLFFRAGAAFGFFDVAAARAYRALLPEDGLVLFLFPVLLFGVLGAAFELGLKARSAGREDRSSMTAFVSALGACLVPVLIQSLRGCVLGCGFTPGQWTLRFLPTIVLLTASLIGLRSAARGGRFAAPLVVVVISAFSTLAFETRFDVAPRLSGAFIIDYALWAALGVLVVAWIDSRTVRAWASVLGLALVAAAASLSSTPDPSVRRAAAEVESNLSATATNSAPPPFNILLVVLDSVRADRLAPTLNRTARTPALDGFAQSSYVFSMAIASSDYSLPSHASLLTGQLPSEHGAHPRLAPSGRGRSHAAMGRSVVTVAQRLSAAGFQTFGVSANYVFLGRWTGLQRGFARFDDQPKRAFRSSPLAPIALGLLAEWAGPPFRPLQPYRTAGEIRRQVEDELSAARSPFFAFVNLMDAHEPRAPRTPRSPLSFREGRTRSYDDAIESLDEELGQLLRWMDERGLLRTTCVVLTSDHGEFLGEGGLWGHAVGVPQTMIHVPLLIRPPGGLSVSTLLDEPFGLHEVMPLLMSSGSTIRPPEIRPQEPRVLSEAWSFPGGGRTATVPDERALFLGRLKLVARRNGERRLFDLGLDPLEQNDLWTSIDPDLRARFETAALKPATEAPTPTGTPDAEALERMRSLGYLGPARKR